IRLGKEHFTHVLQRAKFSFASIHHSFLSFPHRPRYLPKLPLLVTRGPESLDPSFHIFSSSAPRKGTDSPYRRTHPFSDFGTILQIPSSLKINSTPIHRSPFTRLAKDVRLHLPTPLLRPPSYLGTDVGRWAGNKSPVSVPLSLAPLSLSRHDSI
ncbi:hypothetical protein JMJ77_0011191, partial [Colletotrichum scovillei]